MPNGYFEFDSASFTGATTAIYIVPSYWTGSSITIGTQGSILIKYSDTAWKHATNTNDPGTFFLGIQKVSAYVEQTITVPPNTYFAVQFDVSARQLFAVATLKVYCNAAGNTGTTLLLLLFNNNNNNNYYYYY